MTAAAMAPEMKNGRARLMRVILTAGGMRAAAVVAISVVPPGGAPSGGYRRVAGRTTVTFTVIHVVSDCGQENWYEYVSHLMILLSFGALAGALVLLRWSRRRNWARTVSDRCRCRTGTRVNPVSGRGRIPSVA